MLDCTVAECEVTTACGSQSRAFAALEVEQRVEEEERRVEQVERRAEETVGGVEGGGVELSCLNPGSLPTGVDLVCKEVVLSLYLTDWTGVDPAGRVAGSAARAPGRPALNHPPPAGGRRPLPVRATGLDRGNPLPAAGPSPSPARSDPRPGTGPWTELKR